MLQEHEVTNFAHLLRLDSLIRDLLAQVRLVSQEAD